MPIDANIILQGQRPVQDPLQAQLAVQNARNQQQQNAYALMAAQQGAQSGALQLQAQKQAMNDDQAARQLPTGATDEDIMRVAGPKVGGAIIKNREEAKKNHAEVLKLTGEAQNYQSQIAAKQQDYAGHLAQAIKDAGYAPQAVQLAAQQAHSDGYEQQAQQLLGLAQDPAKLQQAVDQMAGRSKSVQDMLSKRQEEDRALQTQQALLPGQQADSRMKQMEANGQAPIQPAQQAQLDIANRNAKQNEVRTNIEMKRLGIDYARLKIDQSKQAGAAGPLNPDSERVAQALASGDFDPKQLGRFGDKEAIVARALNVNPTWNSGTYTANQNYVNGKGKDLIGNIAALEGHMDTLKEASSKAGFSPFISHSVTPAQAGYNLPAQVVTHQLGNIMSNGHVTDEGTVRRIQDGLISPIKATRESAANAIDDVVKENVAAVFQNYKSGTGNPMNPQKFFDAKTIDRLKSKGYIPADSLALMKDAEAPKQAPKPDKRPALSEIFK